MQKKLTVLFAFAIFVLVVGWAITPAQAHCKKNHQGSHIHCTQDDPDFGLRKKPVPLTATFDDVGGDNLQSDESGTYVHKEDGMKVTAGGALPFRIQVGFLGTGKDPRELKIMDVSCDDVGGTGIINLCNEVLTMDFPSGNQDPGAIEVQRANLFLAVIPYEVCPFDDCPDVFTMGTDSENSELMSFRVAFDGGLLIEVASDIGGATSVDAGRCLSLLTEDQRTAFLAAECSNPSECNVTVTAFDDGTGGNVSDDEEIDAWNIDAIGVTALICQLGSGDNFVIGQTTLTFGFDAVKKP